MADDERQNTAAQDHAANDPDTSGADTRRSSASASGGATAGEHGSRNTAATDQTHQRSAAASPDTYRNYGSIHSSSSRPQVTPPLTQPGRTPKKPPLIKRTTSSQHAHRAKGFSVDDSPGEVAADSKLAKTSTGHALRRRESTIRRRTTAQVPTLARVESDETEDRAESFRAEPNRPPPIITDRHNLSDESDETLRPEEEEHEVQVEEVEEDPEGGDGDDDDDDEDEDEDDDDDADLSDAESFTLKDRQQAINETHPFGIRIWKPALYKKDRSVQATAEGDIHSSPGGNVSRWLFLFNILWTIVFGWWLAAVAAAGGILCFLFRFTPAGHDYGTVLLQLSGYLFYPFGKFVKLEHDEAYMEEDQGEGRSITEYERWQTGDLEEGRLFFGPTSTTQSLIGQRRDSTDSAEETDGLLGRPSRGGTQRNNTKKRPFGRGKWTMGRVIFFLFFYGLLTPLLLLVSGICWFMVFTIPMGRVTLLLLYHLRRHPLALSFHSDSHYTRGPGTSASSIVLCTYRAVGTTYWKYTIDGTNIFLINLLGMVAFAIFDFYVLRTALDIRSPITSSGFVFVLSLLSIIPLAYFIGQAVASISAQSSMGVGATINAFFSTIVEVFLYCVALNQGKAQLVEGSIIGSIFAGILLLPGLSMCFGAIKRKTQRFNVRSAGVTSTMLMFAIIGAFCPTLFYQIYGSHELNCHQCVETDPNGVNRDCRRCYFSQAPALQDRFFVEAVRPYIWFAATLLFLSYVIGLLFTLRTHAAQIWNNEPDEKKQEKTEGNTQHPDHRHGATPLDPHSMMTRQTTAGTIGTLPRENIKESQLYKRILGQSLKQAGMPDPNRREDGGTNESTQATNSPVTPYLVPPKSSHENQDRGSVRIPGLSAEVNNALVRQVAEMAATAATVAARDATRNPRKASQMASTGIGSHRHRDSAPHSATSERPHMHRSGTLDNEPEEGHAQAGEAAGNAPGGHDAPNWSRTKSAVILLTATVAYAVIAEILVDTVDSVLEHVDIDEKFLGITLFALVPNTTEFLNAISFAMNGNIALSMEIGSAYALQVMLLQIPALVLYSGVHGQFIDPVDIVDHTFSLIFPQWDMVTVILGLFLMNYVVGEGKSNYFKGSMLVLSYLVVVVGFWFSGYNNIDVKGVNRFDTLAIDTHMEVFKTIGRSKSGPAY